MNNRRRMTGVVTSDKMTKTVVVEISRTYQHPLYKKVVHANSRFKAHNELDAQLGDVVVIVESRPLSRDKRWVVEKIVRRQGEAAVTELVVEDAAEPEVAAPVAEAAKAKAPVAEAVVAETPVAEIAEVEAAVAETAVAETPVAETAEAEVAEGEAAGSETEEGADEPDATGKVEGE